ncbi:MmcB family DNA repair protein [Acinetobacter venetianus]|uniref:MmcB family DNA repair protein n=1 Tax=Acinetobacter venetianus TaxID=52133 RepID=UPI003A8FA731
MKWTHDALMNDLADHLAKQLDRIIWTDMQLGSSGSPRPDVYTIPKSYANFKPLAYECKVSISDFRSDITKGKWQSYLKFASGVIFAVPKGLVSKEDIPKGCGLIVRSENGWRMVKGPTLIAIKNDLPSDFWIKLVIDGVDRSLRSDKQRTVDHRKVNDVICKKYGEDLAILLSDIERAENHLKIKKRHLEDQIGELDLIKAGERTKNDLEDLKSIRAELCKVLDIPDNSNSWTIERLLKEKIKNLNKDNLVRSMRSAVSTTFSSLERQLKELRPLMDGVQDEGAT